MRECMPRLTSNPAGGQFCKYVEMFALTIFRRRTAKDLFLSIYQINPLPKSTFYISLSLTWFFRQLSYLESRLHARLLLN